MKTLIMILAVMATCFTVKAQNCTCYFADCKGMYSQEAVSQAAQNAVCYTKDSIAYYKKGDWYASVYKIDSLTYKDTAGEHVQVFNFTSKSNTGKLILSHYYVKNYQGQTFIGWEYYQGPYGFKAIACSPADNYIVKKCSSALIHFHSSLTKK